MAAVLDITALDAFADVFGAGRGRPDAAAIIRAERHIEGRPAALAEVARLLASSSSRATTLAIAALLTEYRDIAAEFLPDDEDDIAHHVAVRYVDHYQEADHGRTAAIAAALGVDDSIARPRAGAVLEMARSYILLGREELKDTIRTGQLTGIDTLDNLAADCTGWLQAQAFGAIVRDDLVKSQPAAMRQLLAVDDYFTIDGEQALDIARYAHWSAYPMNLRRADEVADHIRADLRALLDGTLNAPAFTAFYRR